MKECTVEAANFVTVHIEGYLDTLRVQGYSPKSIAIYGRGLELFAGFLEQRDITDLQTVTRDQLVEYQLWLQKQGYHAASIEIYLRSLRRLFNYLVDGQYLFLNPAENLTVRPVPRSILPVPSEEDIERLLRQPDTSRPTGIRNRAILETAYGTGARLGELVSLTLHSPDLGEQTIRLMGKGNRERVVPLGKGAVRWIDRYLQEARPRLLKDGTFDALWINTHQQPFGYMSVAHAIRNAGKSAGIDIPISPHSLRRAFATHMLRNGADPVSVQRLLGHVGLRHLSQYLRVTIEEIKSMHRKSTPGR